MKFYLFIYLFSIYIADLMKYFQYIIGETYVEIHFSNGLFTRKGTTENIASCLDYSDKYRNVTTFT